MLDPALDDPQGPRGMGPYASSSRTVRAGSSVRGRASRNMEIQPFTYDSIKTNGWLNGNSARPPARPRATAGPPRSGTPRGISWTSTGSTRTCTEDWDTGGNNRAIQYVVDGLKIKGCGPGLVVARAAIIAAADMLDSDDECTLWAAFSAAGWASAPCRGRRIATTTPRRSMHAPACRAASWPLRAPWLAERGGCGEAVPLRFTADGYRQLDVLSRTAARRSRARWTARRCGCPAQRLHHRGSSDRHGDPRGPEADGEPAGRLPLPLGDAREEWAGTCRELVLTRDDGKQHRAFFRFL